MRSIATLALLSRLTGRRRVAVRTPEPADMGTELGLEHWLDEQTQHAPTAKQAAAYRRAWLPSSLQDGDGR